MLATWLAWDDCLLTAGGVVSACWPPGWPGMTASWQQVAWYQHAGHLAGLGWLPPDSRWRGISMLASWLAWDDCLLTAGGVVSACWPPGWPGMTASWQQVAWYQHAGHLAGLGWLPPDSRWRGISMLATWLAWNDCLLTAGGVVSACWPPGWQGWGEYYSGTRLAQNDKHEYTKNTVLEYWFSSTRTRMFSTRPSPAGWPGMTASWQQVAWYQHAGLLAGLGWLPPDSRWRGISMLATWLAWDDCLLTAGGVVSACWPSGWPGMTASWQQVAWYQHAGHLAGLGWLPPDSRWRGISMLATWLAWDDCLLTAGGMVSACWPPGWPGMTASWQQVAWLSACWPPGWYGITGQGVLQYHNSGFPAGI